VQHLGLLDIAVSSHSTRKQWLIILKSLNCKAIDVWRHSNLSIRWVIKRSIHVSHVLVHFNHCDTISDLTFQAIGINVSRVSCGEEVSRDYTLSIWGGHKYPHSIDLNNCRGITDKLISALTYGCGQLQTIDISVCRGITDASMSAMGDRCGQLQAINLRKCDQITDIGLSALGRGCGHLKTVNLDCCEGITDIGVSALGDGCSQLQRIILRQCQGVTDIGILA
jgi:Leucine Rich repeat